MDAIDPKDLHPQTLLGMKLIQQPFSKLPVAEKLFDFDALKQTRDTVSHHLQFSQLIMVVQGDSGSGKNSFANSLIIGDHPALYYFNATADDDDSLQSLLNKAATNNKADSISTLEKRIQDILFRGQQPVLIVNDAHRLHAEVLRELIDYSKNKKDNNQQTHLKLLLLGQRSLEKKLETNGIVNHAQFYIITLPLFNVSNTANFLLHRLTSAGYRDANPFTEKDIKSIYAEASGNPEATMMAAAHILNNKKELLEETVRLPGKQKQYLLILGGIIVIAGIIYNNFLSTPDTDKQQTLSLQLDNKMPAQQPQKNTNNNAAVNQLFKNSQNTMDVKQAPATAAIEPLQPAITLPEKPVVEDDSPDENSPAADTSTSPALTSMDSTQPTIKPHSEAAITKPVQAPVQPEVTAPATPPAQPKATAPVTVTEKVKTPVVKQVAKPAPEITTKPVAEDSITRSFKNAGAHTADWLLQQPAGNWSLQILAAYKAETLLSFTHQHKLRDKVAYYRTRLGNKDWHVLLYGQYQSKDEAKAAIEYLPAYIKTQKPWAKDMASIQKALKQGQ